MKKVKKSLLENGKNSKEDAKILLCRLRRENFEGNGGQAAKADSLAGLARKSGALAKSFGWRISGFWAFWRIKSGLRWISIGSVVVLPMMKKGISPHLVKAIFSGNRFRLYQT